MSRHLVREGARSYECGGPGTIMSCAECAGYDPIAALRAELATVTAERNSLRVELIDNRAGLHVEVARSGELKAALESKDGVVRELVAHNDAWRTGQAKAENRCHELSVALSASCAETAAATARIAELERELELLRAE